MTDHPAPRRRPAVVLLRASGLATLSVVVFLLFTGTGASASDTVAPGASPPSTLPLFALGVVAVGLLVVAHLLRRPDPAAQLVDQTVGD